MAEKEERIAIAKMIVNTDDEGSAKLDHFKIYNCQEAIKKIEKHLIASTIKFNTTADVVAEIALNGLLEGK